MAKNDPPSYLGTEGKKKWAEILTLLPRRTREDLDRDSLGLLCANWEIFLKAKTDLDKNGPVLHGTNGRSWHNPAATSFDAAVKAIMKLSALLGLTKPLGEDEDAPPPGLLDE